MRGLAGLPGAVGTCSHRQAPPRTAMDNRVTSDHIAIHSISTAGEGRRVQLEPEEAQQNPAVAAFIAELRHWREVAGYSQKALAKLVGYTPSYVSKVERGTMLASRSFAESADQHLRAGRALVRRWRDMHEALVELSGGRARHDEPPADDPQSAPGPDLVVEHEQRRADLPGRRVPDPYPAAFAEHGCAAGDAVPGPDCSGPVPR